MTHLPVLKTYKLFINGGFPRTESGRSEKSEKVTGPDGTIVAHICRASRKDLRDAVEAARAAQSGWGGRAAYNRGQVLYRMAEMLEGRQGAFVEAILATDGNKSDEAARREVQAAVDRLVGFAGWTDKIAPVLGGHNPVAGPYYNLTVPEPTGVVAVVAPDEPALLGLVSLLAPPLCAGNTVIVVAGVRHPLPAALWGEVCATSDVPAGVVNVLTGRREELLGPLAEHRDVNAISAANLDQDQHVTLRQGTAQNLKRVRTERLEVDAWYDPSICESPWRIEPFVEMKTIWHPSAI
ncbi:MAG: aldehyde dehydrogenase family protein [Planctomycetota bacterium]|jgi:acyl-CoA reductase-like NAD-dependent aldehyde dehydrogenase